MDFPGSALVADRLRALGRQPLVITREDVMVGRWPETTSTTPNTSSDANGHAVVPRVGYGTMHTMTRLARASPSATRGLNAAVFDDYAKLKCSVYYRSIYDLLGRLCVLVPFYAVPTLPLERMFAAERVFIRSDTNYKLFPASEMHIANIPDWLDTHREHKDELVVVSEVVAFDREYRCFFRNADFICGSSYAKLPLPLEEYEPVPQPVRDFAARAARRMLHAGANMITVDVGVSKADGDGSGADVMRVVEIGGVNSWGVYGSNLDDFIRAMDAEALERAGL